MDRAINFTFLSYRIRGAYDTYVVMGPRDIWTGDGEVWKNGVKSTDTTNIPSSMYQGCAAKIDDSRLVAIKNQQAFLVDWATLAVTTVTDQTTYSRCENFFVPRFPGNRLCRECRPFPGILENAWSLRKSRDLLLHSTFS